MSAKTKFLIIFISIVMTFLIYLSTTNIATQYIRNMHPITILIKGTTNNNLDGLMLLHYNPRRQIFAIFPISTNLKYLYNDKNTSLKNIYKDIDDIKSFIDQTYTINSDFIININSSTINDIYKTLKISYQEINTEYKNLISDVAIDEQYGTISKITSQLHSIKAFLKYIHLISILKNNSNLSTIDCISLFLESKNFRPQNIILVYPPEQEKQINNTEYIKKFIDNIDVVKRNKTISVEMLNASNIKGLAYKTTKTIRDKYIDVQLWENYPTVVPISIVVDRIGNWRNAQIVSLQLKKRPSIVVSKIDLNRFIDVSIILGEDTK